MKISLIIFATFQKTAPNIKITTNKDSTELELKQGENLLDVNLNIESEDNISLTFLNKDDMDNNIVEIKKILIDDIDLQHFIFEGIFTPIYNNEWYNSLDIKPPKFYQPGTEMRHNGSWVLPIKTPIWKMLMERWIDDQKHVA